MSATAAEKNAGPKYELLSSLDKSVELRRYPARLVAQVEVSGDGKEALNQAFRILAGYIFGKNTQKHNLPMTSPVVAQSQKLPMTSPVTAQVSPTRTIMSFFMPQSCSLETVPSPSDSRINIVELPPQRYAAIRFSGSWDQNDFSKQAGKLLDCLSKNALKPSGNAVNAYYNPPFTLPFLRRNEVLVPVAD